MSVSFCIILFVVLNNPPTAYFSKEQVNRLSKGFIAIEVWIRNTECGAEKDEIIGLAKVATLGLISFNQQNAPTVKLTDSRVSQLDNDGINKKVTN